METSDNIHRSGHVSGGSVQDMTNSQQLGGCWWCVCAKNIEVLIRLWLPLTPGSNWDQSHTGGLTHRSLIPPIYTSNEHAKHVQYCVLGSGSRPLKTQRFSKLWFICFAQLYYNIFLEILENKTKTYDSTYLVPKTETLTQLKHHTQPIKVARSPFLKVGVSHLKWWISVGYLKCEGRPEALEHFR